VASGLELVEVHIQLESDAAVIVAGAGLFDACLRPARALGEGDALEQEQALDAVHGLHAALDHRLEQMAQTPQLSIRRRGNANAEELLSPEIFREFVGIDAVGLVPFEGQGRWSRKRPKPEWSVAQSLRRNSSTWCTACR
jgi:hypothetical protein